MIIFLGSQIYLHCVYDDAIILHRIWVSWQTDVISCDVQVLCNDKDANIYDSLLYISFNDRPCLCFYKVMLLITFHVN